jgi:BAI1-associated protein 3
MDEDAILLFSVYDHDVITYNDFGGEAFLSLKDVPGIQGGKQKVGNFHGLKQVELALMFQENLG